MMSLLRELPLQLSHTVHETLPDGSIGSKQRDDSLFALACQILIIKKWGVGGWFLFWGFGW